MLLLLDTFWFVWMLKYTLFWLYLWQLKEYHTGRFSDHFRTFKGRRLLFSFEQIFKLVLLAFLFLTPDLFSLLFSIAVLVYIAETLLFFRAILNRAVKKPVQTFKILFLIFVSFAVVISFLYWTFGQKDSAQTALLLGFDILTPLIISFIVLLFQPFFVVARNSKLEKAAEKMKQVKSLNNLKVIAITGSYGKTSTKEFLATILAKKFKVLSTKEHQNSEIGIAKCILEDLKPRPAGGYPEIFIAEVGAYNKGKVEEVCQMIKPKIGIVTGVNEQHLALFGSLENLLSAEGGQELAHALPKDGILVVNGDNKFCLKLYKNVQDKTKKIYSLSNKIIDADIWASEISAHKNYISFVATGRSGDMAHFDVKVLGKQNVQNLLGAILIARELGMNFGEISEACKNIKQEQAGMVLLQGKHNLEIIDSSYSANPDGVFADLEYFSIFNQKRVIVMPCLIELGKKSGEIHEKIGRKIGETCDMAIITSKDKFQGIKKGFDDAQKEKSDILRRSEQNVVKCLLCDTSEQIYSAITSFCKSGDAVLLEGRVPAGLINLLKK